MAEDLTKYLKDLNVKSYIHAFRYRYLRKNEDDRTSRDFGEVDVLIGINLLREGLDIPEVALVAILDADKKDS